MATLAAAVNHPGQVKVAHILVEPKDEPLLDELGEQIAAGVATFAELAATHSKCPSGKQGGALGWISRGQTVGEFERAAFTTPVGGTSKATTSFGVHLIEVLDARANAPTIVDVSIQDLQEVLEGDLDEVNLIDVREQNEWDAARIEAFNLRPLSTMQQWSPRLLDDFDPAKPTYVICAAGVRSARAAAALTDLGFDDVRNVSGGMYAYGGPNLVTGK